MKLAVFLLAALALPRVAAAADGESALSVSAGAGTFVMPGEEDDETIAPTAGGVLGVAYEKGFSEAWSWRLDLSGALYGGGGLSYSANVAGGIVYRFDVLKYVPYGLLELGGVIVGGGPVPEDDSPVLAPVLQLGGGLDILQSRENSWGIEARVATFLDDVTTVAISGRYTWRWGWF